MSLITGEHPAASLFPLMVEEEFAGLLADIKKHGQIEPAVVTSQGLLLDGRNRHRACQKLGLQTIVVVKDPPDPVEFVYSLNLHRRHLTVGQRAIQIAKLATVTHGGDRVSNEQRPKKAFEETHVFVTPLTADQAATKANVSRSSVVAAKRVLREGSEELIAKVESGAISLKSAEDQVVGDKPQKAPVVVKPPVSISPSYYQSSAVTAVETFLIQFRKIRGVSSLSNSSHKALTSGDQEWVDLQRAKMLKVIGLMEGLVDILDSSEARAFGMQTGFLVDEDAWYLKYLGE